MRRAESGDGFGGTAGDGCEIALRVKPPGSGSGENGERKVRTVMWPGEGAPYVVQAVPAAPFPMAAHFISSLETLSTDFPSAPGGKGSV